MYSKRIRRQLIYDGNVIIKFTIKIYEFQSIENRSFLHEYFAIACSWKLLRIAAIKKLRSVCEIIDYLYNYDLVTVGFMSGYY